MKDLTFQDLHAQFQKLSNPSKNFRKQMEGEWYRKLQSFLVDIKRFVKENPNDETALFMLKTAQKWNLSE